MINTYSVVSVTIGTVSTVKDSILEVVLTLPAPSETSTLIIYVSSEEDDVVS